jgi:hypothetical protein
LQEMSAKAFPLISFILNVISIMVFISVNVKGRHGVESRSDVTELSYPALFELVLN